MEPEAKHAACVDGWLARAAPATREALLQLFEAALDTLWQRTKITLGEITMVAILDRVLHNSSERFPFCEWIEIDAVHGLSFQKLRAQAGTLHEPDLKRGVRFVLVKFLTVLGNLTAEILTPPLHAALAKVRLADGQANPPRREGNPS